METTVEVPTANIRDRANSAVTKGDAMLMAVMAVTETPFATNSPSTAVYRVYTHWASMDGMIYRMYSERRDLGSPLNCIMCTSFR